MRILALVDKNSNEYSAFEVIDVEYDSESKSVDFYAQDGCCYSISNLSIYESNQICINLVLQGYCDVTRYGELTTFNDE